MTILKRIDYDPERTIVATIGLLYIIQQLTLMTYGPEARPVEAPFNQRIAIPWIEWARRAYNLLPWGLSTTTYKMAVIGAAAAVLAGVWLMMARTRIGLLMRATQADREMALAFGIPVERVYALVFGLGAGLAALAAVLIVPIQQAHYLMGADPLLLSFIVVIIGGLGSLPGTVVAAVFIGLSTGSSRSSSRPRWPRSWPRCWWAGAGLPPAGPVRDARGMSATARILALHGGLLAVLFALQFVLPAYHHGNLARIMVLASYAIGLQYPFRLYRPAQPRARAVLRRGHVRHGADDPACRGRARPALLAGVRGGGGVRRAGAAGAAHLRGGLPDRDADVRAGGIPDHPVFRRHHPRRRGVRHPGGERVLWGIDLSDPTNRYSRPGCCFAAASCLPLAGARALRQDAGGDPRERGAGADAGL